MTLAPNTQITQENVGLLKAGDVLRDDYAQLFTFASLLASDTVSIQRYQGDDPTRFMVSLVSSLTYIGPDHGDGWIGWSGGENPVPGMTVQWKARDGVSGKSYCAWGWEWSATDPDRDIIAFRPALSPPAEDHIGDATEKVDWERVGPKLVEAVAWQVRDNGWREINDPDWWRSQGYEVRALGVIATPAQPDTGDVAGLHHATAFLVDRFAAALKAKLAKAEAKYGYRDGWREHDWQPDLVAKLVEHVHKGDPRDVAAYCAFAWHHGWSITPPDTGDVAALRDLERLINQSGPVPKGELRAILAALSKPKAPGAPEDGGA